MFSVVRIVLVSTLRHLIINRIVFEPNLGIIDNIFENIGSSNLCDRNQDSVNDAQHGNEVYKCLNGLSLDIMNAAVTTSKHSHNFSNCF